MDYIIAASFNLPGIDTQWSVGLLCVLGIIALFAEFVDSSLGMGYGTMLTPLLIVMGFDVHDVVPAILLSELFTGFVAAVCHHRMGNVDFLPRLNAVEMKKMFSGEYAGGISAFFVEKFPLNLRVALLLGLCSVIGALSAACVAVSIPRMYLKLYIAAVLIAVGIFVLLTLNRQMRFSWVRCAALGVVAAFNKGLSGGGYGPLVVSGQLLSGIKASNAVGIVSFSEALACLAAVSVFLLRGGSFNLPLTAALCIGAILSAPLASVVVSRISGQALKRMIAFCTVLLGMLTFYKAIG